jgi:2',3'-cyclic-nucleotide 2'-phosphodiesterase (5'-nucleotidase family)/formiminotetrahydrofolate cyclodeaminase
MDAVSSAGSLCLISADPNPNGASDSALYLFCGDAAASPITTVTPEQGLKFPGPAAFLSQQDFHLRIYHFNDLHGHLVRFTPEREEAVVSRVAWQLQSAHKQIRTDPYKAVLTLSAGDECIGSVFDELLGNSPLDYQVHASYRLYSAMGVDAAVLGNHDFDKGLPLLEHAIQREARFPILAANLSGCKELAGLVFPAAVLVVKGLRIGLIGLVTRAEARIIDSECRVVEPLQVLHRLLPVVRPYCDLLIVLSHLGYSLEAGSAQMIDAGDVELAHSLPYRGVDLIIGGHSHTALNTAGLTPENIVNGIPIVQAGALGRFLGKVDITLRRGQASVSQVRLVPIDSIPTDPVFDQEQVQPLISQARSLFSRILGRVENNPELSADAVQNSCAAGELALANFITDALCARLQRMGIAVDVAMIDSSSLYDGLPAGGSLTFGDWFKVMPFADTIRLYQLTGQQLYDLLQDNAGRVDRPGEPHTERGFLHFSRQLRYTLYLGEDRARAWAGDITLNGMPLCDQRDQNFIVVGTSFIRELASPWERQESASSRACLFNLDGLPYSETDVFLRNELVAYIQEHEGVTRSAGASCDGRLQVVPGSVSPITRLGVDAFIQTVSSQNHAMAGAVIALSAAQAAALGQACLRISRDSGKPASEAEAAIKALSILKNELLQWCNRDANAIAELVTLRQEGQELAGQLLLCQAPARVCQLSIKAADILKKGRFFVNERVKDDLEMSITLLASAAQTAWLLLDSNLRIWPEADLLGAFEPVLAETAARIEAIQPVKRIRNGR